MEVIHSSICGGKIRLHTVHTDKFKMSRFSLNFITKSDKYRTPLYKLMLSVVMRGSEKYPTIVDINKALDDRYGSLVSYRSSRMGEKEIFKFSCRLLNQRFVFGNDQTIILDEVVEILSNILTRPLRDENGLLLSPYVESEKKIAIDTIHAKINDPKAYASERCSQYMFEGTEYELNDGNIELINSFTPDDLTKGLQAFFDEAQVECYYIGNDSHEHIKKLVQKHMIFNCQTESVSVYSERPLMRDRDEVRYVEEERDVSQGRLVLGYKCNTVLADEDYYSMALFNEIFGGGSVSKLFINVREKKSLCYYCYSSLHSATGTIKVGCGIDPAKKDEALSEIGVQLEAMKQGDFTDSEIETARHTVASGIKQIDDSPSSIESFTFRRMLAGISDTAEKSLEKLYNVTREDILNAAQKVVLDTVYFLNGIDEEDGIYE